MATNLYDPAAKGKKPLPTDGPVPAEPDGGAYQGPAMGTNGANLYDPAGDKGAKPPDAGPQPADPWGGGGYQGPAATTNGGANLGAPASPGAQPGATTNTGQNLGDPGAAAPAHGTIALPGAMFDSSGGQNLGGGGTPAATTSGGQNLGGGNPAATTSPVGNPAAPTGPVAIAPHDQVPMTAQPGAGGADPFASSGGGQFLNGGWIPNSNTGAIQAAGGTPGAAAPGTPGAPAAGTPGAPAAPATTISGAFQSALMQQLGQPATVSATDASVAPQIQQNTVTQQRSFERRRQQMAERAAQSGTSGAMDAGIDSLSAARGDAEAAGSNAILGDANKSRQQSLQSALAMGGQYLSQQDQIAANKMLADQDAEIRRLGITSQSSLGSAELAQRGQLGQGQLNLGLLGLMQGGQQFGQQLGSNNAQFSANLNQNALMNLLNGVR